jgi:hypothetical protein
VSAGPLAGRAIAPGGAIARSEPNGTIACTRHADPVQISASGPSPVSIAEARAAPQREASSQTRDHRFQGIHADIVVKAVEPILQRVLDHGLSRRSHQLLKRQCLETGQIERTITRRR